MRHSVKASLSLLLALCAMALIVAPCLADPALALTFGEAFTAGASAYAAQYGFAYEYSSNGYSSSITNPSSWNNVSMMQDDLYEEYYAQADPSKYDKLPLPSKWTENYHDTEWYHLVNEDVEPYAKHSSGSFAPISELNYGSDITEIYDDYFNWLLGTKLGLTRNSNGVFVLPNASYSVPITSYTLPVGVQSSSLMPYTTERPTRYNNAYIFVENSSRFVGIYKDRSNKSEVITLFPFHVGTTIYVVCSINWVSAGYKFNLANWYLNYPGGDATDLGYNTSVSYDSATGLYYCTTGSGYTLSGTWHIPEFDSLATALAFVGIVNETGESGSYALDITTDDGTVNTPDTEDENYLPAPLGIPLNIPWKSGFADDIDLLFDNILNESLENELEAVDEIADPVPVEPVMPPFLPAQVPSLRFNLSGIWYYVVRWVNSTSAGLGFFSSIWNNIPAAMFYPVFGSAVAVLVLGVFRRFFG